MLLWHWPLLISTLFAIFQWMHAKSWNESAKTWSKVYFSVKCLIFLGVSSVSLDLCTRTAGSRCDSKCNSEYDPVCASGNWRWANTHFLQTVFVLSAYFTKFLALDGRTYLNKCTMQVENCMWVWNNIKCSLGDPWGVIFLNCR